MKPTRKQLNYLRALAQRTGQTFAYPQTMEDASNEIDRLKGVKATPRSDRRRELRDIQDDLATGRGDAARVRDNELSGYGSTATWAGRQDAA